MDVEQINKLHIIGIIFPIYPSASKKIQPGLICDRFLRSYGYPLDDGSGGEVIVINRFEEMGGGNKLNKSCY